MGACCTSENKSKHISNKHIPTEKKEPLHLHLKNGGAGRKSIHTTDIDEKVDLILKPVAAGVEIGELQNILNSGKIKINDYLVKESNETLLTKAIRNNSNPEVIKILLDFGADVNICERASGHSPLILACLNLNKNIVELILSRSPSLKVGSEDANEKMDKDLIVYLKRKFSGRALKGENTWEEIRDVLEEYINNNNRS